MTKTFIIDKRQKPIEEQLREVTGAKKHPGIQNDRSISFVDQ